MNTATTNSRKSMPQAANVPPPQTRANTQDQVWAEDAARAAQRHFDMAAEITRLTADMEEWRRRAIASEQDMKRATEREIVLQQQIDTRNSQLNTERDIFKETIVKLSTQFGTASQIILDAHRLMDEVLGRKAQVSLSALAVEIDRATVEKAWEDDPQVVREGPREPNQR